MGVLCFKPHVLIILFIVYIMLKGKHIMLEGEVYHGTVGRPTVASVSSERSLFVLEELQLMLSPSFSFYHLVPFT